MGDYPHVNQVSLIGRLSDRPTVKALPSGDLIMMWRLIVDRPAIERRTPRRVVDTINCVTFDNRLFGPAHEWRPDDVLELHGALRRRFWPGGSTCEVMVQRATRRDRSPTTDGPRRTTPRRTTPRRTARADGGALADEQADA